MTASNSKWQILDAFSTQARQSTKPAVLAELAASTAATLSGSSLTVAWLLTPSDVAPSHLGVFGLQPGSDERTQACPPRVKEWMGAEGSHNRSDVAREDFGLPPGDPFPSLHSLGVRLSGNSGVWIGIRGAPAQALNAEPDPELIASLRLLVQLLSTVLEKHIAEEQGRASEFKYRTLVEQIPAVTYCRGLDAEGHASFMSPQVQEILGYSPEDFVGDAKLFAERLHPDDRAWVQKAQKAYKPAETTSTLKASYRMIHKDGRTVWVSNHALAVRDENGVPQFVLGVIFDISETKQLEEQYRHSQKLEAVGRLAGGIAHDFNNLLAVILGYGWMIDDNLPASDPHKYRITELVAAGERAKQLVGQLLSFSRRQVAQPEWLQLGIVLADVQSMFLRIASDRIEVTCHTGPELGSTWIDRGELEQVVMNLLVNAADAMPEGGPVNIEASNVVLDETFTATHHEAEPGEYVMFSISDSGIGMTPEIQRQILEPFFTTKERGKGTGLGLSTVHSIVKGNGGSVWIYSEPGQGTTVKVYLPRNPGQFVPTEAEASSSSPVTGGNEHILIVEDDNSLRNLISDILKGLGYSVESANNAERARECFMAKPFALVLSDVIMPDTNGPALLIEFQKRCPGLRTLLMSGYTDDALEKYAQEEFDVPLLLRKPFTVAELAARVRSALDQEET
ncbi:MAG: PAS domain-containing protein [Polyangiaceae bacterium]|nr:PAS domain-containing protein [Polyangiaceae bacterium]